jgi:hypothetical protein
MPILRPGVQGRDLALPLVSLPGLVSLALLASSASSAADGPSEVLASAPGTIGLAVTDWHYALVETADGKEECPAGLQAGEASQFKAQPDYLEHVKKFGGTFENRGPDGEKGNFSPQMVQDPIPWRELQSKRGYGVNLDGTSDGHATPKTCEHTKFTGPDGAQVDNQMARVVGCIQGFRTSGLTIEFYRNEIVNSAANRLLIEITGVDDANNDPHVGVTLYKGRDQLVRTAAGSTFVPLMSQRIDERFPQYTLKTHGKIVDGVLITDPIPFARLPISWTRNVGERHLQDFTLRLKLTDEGAEGLFAGYENLATWWNIQSKSVTPELDRYSPAGMYRALHRYADGYPDPATGECTAISVAYQVKAVRALVVHPSDRAASTMTRTASTR